MVFTFFFFPLADSGLSGTSVKLWVCGGNDQLLCFFMKILAVFMMISL